MTTQDSTSNPDELALTIDALWPSESHYVDDWHPDDRAFYRAAGSMGLNFEQAHERIREMRVERMRDAILARWRLVSVEEDAERPDYYRGYRDAQELTQEKVRSVIAQAVADGKQIDTASRSGSIGTSSALVQTYAFALDEIARIVGYQPQENS